MNHLEVTNVSKHFGKKTILDNVSFCIAPGDCVGIIGKNGTGKSTLTKIIAGVCKYEIGSVVSNVPIAYVPQENGLFPEMSVLDNLRLAYSDSKRSLKEDLKKGPICDFGLSEYLHFKVSKLSGGFKKKLGILCALIKEPGLLMLDEPGAALDIIFKNDIIQIIKDFCAKGGSVLLISHETLELSCCNRFLLLKDAFLSELPSSADAQSLCKLLV